MRKIPAAFLFLPFFAAGLPAAARSQTVTGVQEFKYLGVGDVRPGAIVLEGKVLYEAADQSWVAFSPDSSWGWFVFKVFRERRAPADADQGPAWADLISTAPKVRLKGTLSSVASDGQAFDGEFLFHRERIQLHFALIEGQDRGPLPGPARRNIPYGPDWRQTMDLYRAASPGPTPVVVFIHGGAWIAGDKSEIDGYGDLLRAGISVVAVNYRLCPHADPDANTPAVAIPMRDAARAVQFIRRHAAEWGLLPDRLGLWGESAGACTALWMGLHADMADPKAADPVARESTVPACVAAVVPQTTLDPEQMKAWVGPKIDYGAHAFGIDVPRGRSPASFREFLGRRGEFLPWIEEYSPAAQVRPGGPPIFLDYEDEGMTPFLPDDDYYPHSPGFGVGFQRLADQRGHESYLRYQGHESGRYGDWREFLVAHLAPNTAIAPTSRGQWWLKRHRQFLSDPGRGQAKVVFMGDSLTDLWRYDEETGTPRGKQVWDRFFAPLHAVNFGIDGNRTQDLLWQIGHGELADLPARLVVLLIGTNNVARNRDGSVRNTPEETIAGIAAVLQAIRIQLPRAQILLLGIFPRDGKDNPVRGHIRQVNQALARFDDGVFIHYLDLGSKFLAADGSVPPSLFPDLLHPNRDGYEVWAKAMIDPLRSLLTHPPPP